MNAQTQMTPPDPKLVKEQVEQALREDLGDGDRTAALIPADAVARATIVCREPAVICGRPWVDQVFAQLDPAIRIRWQVQDGDAVRAETPVCTLDGPARALLSGERTALNYLQTLSGVASVARTYAEAVADLGTCILDTRKTLPGLRLQQKYAVRCGGCHNHRIGLYDAILIKENHIAAAGGIGAALEEARRCAGGLEIEIEVEDLSGLEEALDAGAKRVLLDNFPLDTLREAVTLNAGRARLEASGSMSLEQLRRVAETGVDDISVGALTKHLRAVDLSMRFV